jgi:16S rRNA pseudouridine516 synthase
MRLDKYLCEQNIGTRSQVKTFIRQGQVTVTANALGCPDPPITITSPDYQVDPTRDHVTFRGQSLHYERYSYYMLNKPAGVLSATADNHAPTVIELLRRTPAVSSTVTNPPVDEGVKARDLFPVGRLDKDTEGLLIITNDGALAHELLSPRKKVPKIYLLHIRSPLTDDDIAVLTAGVDIGDAKPTAPAELTVVAPLILRLTITEGRYHQVKRMLLAVGNQVLYLKRLSMGGLWLDEQLLPGQYRALLPDELKRLKLI